MAHQFKTSEPRPGGAFTLLEPGEYNFQVLDASETHSQAGNDMIELKLDVISKDKKSSSTVYDNLVFTEKAAWKINAFLKSCGMHPGEGREITIVPDEFIGWEGECRIANEADNKGVMRNKVQGYTWPNPYGF
jgi:Protein of unknown function (DUF669)